MHESDALPPGWRQFDSGGYERIIGPYSLYVRDHRGFFTVSVYVSRTPIRSVEEVICALPDACRRAEELARELAAWRPPALPHTEGEG